MSKLEIGKNRFRVATYMNIYIYIYIYLCFRVAIYFVCFVPATAQGFNRVVIKFE